MTLALDRPQASDSRLPFGQEWAALLAPLLGYGRAAGADLVEIFLERNQYLSGMAEEDQITSVSPRLGSGAGIRVFVGQRDSYVSTNDLTAQGLQAALERALGILGLSLPDPRTRLIPDFNVGLLRDYAVVKQGWLARCSSMQEMGEVLLSTNGALARHASHIQSRRSVYFRDWQEVLVAASDGTFARDIRLTQSLACTLLCADGPHRTSLGRRFGNTSDPDFLRTWDPEGVAVELGAAAGQMLYADFV
ncbi:MAG: DNA gyrase modulator, partial [Thermostichales cyanobacterium BF3_bins_165]